MTVRHNLVHGRISVAGAPHFYAIRFPPKQQPVTIVGTTDELHRLNQQMRKLSRSLEAVMPPEYRRLRYDA